MNASHRFAGSLRDAGSALLIAIFALLLISVVGLALVVSTGTDTALAGNYRNSTGAYYAAVAGLEEGRGRLLWKNPDFVNKTNAYPTLFSAQGVPTFGVTDVVYILNPANGETVDPTNGSSPYADTQYATEMGWSLSSANVHTPIASVSPMAGLPGPAYKWVRINPVTEKGLGLDINNSGGTPNSFTPLYYNGNGLNLLSSGNEALEITAFVVMPDKSTRLLQYVVAPTSLSLTFPASLTLAGNGVSYSGPNSTGFYVTGNDAGPPLNCSSSPWPIVPALGYTTNTDSPTARPTAWTTFHPENYQGSGYMPAPPPPATPSIGLVGFPPTLQTPSQFESLIQTITQNADLVLTPPMSSTTVPRSAIPTTMTQNNPMTIVVNGDLDLTTGGAQITGYGLLLVIGAASVNPALTYDPDVTWEGIVLVIGKGTVIGSHGGGGRIDGAMIVAQTRDAAGNPLPNLGPASVAFDAAMGGTGVYYNSCFIQQALAPTTYRALSFREIAQ